MITHVYRLLDDSLLEVIESRGHIPLVYCGGTTPIVQMNDTNVHARIVELINDTYLHARIDMWPVERHGSGWDEEGEENSVAFEAESDA